MRKSKLDRKLNKFEGKLYKLLKKYKLREHIKSSSLYYIRFTRKD